MMVDGLMGSLVDAQFSEDVSVAIISVLALALNANLEHLKNLLQGPFAIHNHLSKLRTKTAIGGPSLRLSLPLLLGCRVPSDLSA